MKKFLTTLVFAGIALCVSAQANLLDSFTDIWAAPYDATTGTITFQESWGTCGVVYDTPADWSDYLSVDIELEQASIPLFVVVTYAEAEKTVVTIPAGTSSAKIPLDGVGKKAVKQFDIECDEISGNVAVKFNSVSLVGYDFANVLPDMSVIYGPQSSYNAETGVMTFGDSWATIGVNYGDVNLDQFTVFEVETEPSDILVFVVVEYNAINAETGRHERSLGRIEPGETKLVVYLEDAFKNSVYQVDFECDEVDAAHDVKILKAGFAEKDNTFVEEVAVKNANVDIYNLQGVKVRSNVSHNETTALPSGLYIVDGKKILVK